MKAPLRHTVQRASDLQAKQLAGQAMQTEVLLSKYIRSGIHLRVAKSNCLLSLELQDKQVLSVEQVRQS